LDTGKVRQEAGAYLAKAEEALVEGKIDEYEKLKEEALSSIATAEAIDKAASDLKVLKGEFNKPTNTVPLASKDVAAYDPDDNGARNKASYKPASWVKGLPAMAQPLWVQEKMGATEKADAQFQIDTFATWLRAPSENMFWKTATPDQVKAMQEDKLVSLTSVTV
jgi:hypothetical protein